MRLLILGGTHFLGRHVAEAALRKGAALTLFHRGRTSRELFPEASHILGDRAGDLGSLREGHWDAVIDTCGYFPSVVRSSARVLKGRADRYIFISTVSVYSEWGRDHEESSTVQFWEGPEPKERSPETYGPLKAGCEREVLDAFGEGAWILRPGLIAGRWDPTDRFTYWPMRLARGGDALAPGNPARRVQVIDARDLADWALTLASSEKGGIFNACGEPKAMKDILVQCLEETGRRSRLHWVSEDFLQARGVEPYTEMPLWIPGVDDNFRCEAALAAGLRRRSLDETIRDAYAWRASSAGGPLKAGLPEEKEAELLRAWRQSKVV